MAIRYPLAPLVSMAVSPTFAWATEAITISGGTFTLMAIGIAILE